MVEETAEWVKDEFEMDCPEDSYKLLVHCKGGFGRTGTMLTLINAMLTIIEQGQDMEESESVKEDEEESKSFSESNTKKIGNVFLLGYEDKEVSSESLSSNFQTPTGPKVRITAAAAPTAT